MSEISDRILAAIKRKGITYAELAEKTGIPKTALHRYATGDTEKISTTRIALLAKALDVSIGYLTGWEDDEAPRQPSIEDYERIGVAARMKPTPTPAPTTDDILSQLQSLERQLKTQISLSATEQQLISDFRALPKSAQGKVRAYIDGLFDRLEGK